jgi:DNA polymerase III subunit gamma/tau
MAWHRKYRPKLVSELHLDSVREALEKMLLNGQIPQVLLFAGPKGTGKTSTSRILGVLLNDKSNEELVDSLFFKQKKIKKSFNEPDIKLDFAQRVYDGHSFIVQEMDAASNRGIDDIRVLKERAMMPPAEGKMAVYILDEVHMLTSEAFNALLKLLEEPPPHAVFILATTELHKIPATIVSRCTKINFKKASVKEISAALKTVLEQEGIKFEDEDLVIIAKKADGSFRDAVKMLELVCQSGELNSDDLEALLGGNYEEKITNLLKAVLEKDAVTLTRIIQSLKDESIDQKFFYQALFDYLHDQLLIALGIENGEAFANEKVIRFILVELLKADLSQPTTISFLSLELKLLEIIERASSRKLENQKTRKLEVKKKIIKKPIVTGDSLFDKWEQFIDLVREKNSGLAMILQSCKVNPSSNGVVKISVYYPFHKDQLNQPKHISILEQCCLSLMGFEPKFEYLIEKKLKEKPLKDSGNNLTDVATKALM